MMLGASCPHGEQKKSKSTLIIKSFNGQRRVIDCVKSQEGDRVGVS